MRSHRRYSGLPLAVIDTVGGCAVAACVAAFAWLTLVRADSPGASLPRLRADVTDLNFDLAQAREAADRKRATLAALNVQLSECGRLPEIPPVTEYSQTLTKWAKAFDLQVISHRPLTSRDYPGLSEHRFVFQVLGTWPNMMRFLQYVETSDYWADVSYIKIGDPQPRVQVDIPERLGTFTFSVFAAPPAEHSITASNG